jgi:hypothetical protein
MTDVAPILEAIAVRPGDTLVIRVNEGIDRAELDGFRADAEAVLAKQAPGVKFVVVAAEQLAVCRAEDGADA